MYECTKMVTCIWPYSTPFGRTEKEIESRQNLYHELGPAVNKTSHPTLTIMFLQIHCCSVDEHYLGRVTTSQSYQPSYDYD